MIEKKISKMIYKIEKDDYYMKLVIYYEDLRYEILPSRGDRFNFCSLTPRSADWVVIGELIQEAAKIGNSEIFKLTQAWDD